MRPRTIATPALLAALANLGLAAYPNPDLTCSPIVIFDRCHAADEPSPYSPYPPPIAAAPTPVTGSTSAVWDVDRWDTGRWG